MLREVIVYEDEDLIVCHKPAGMAVQSAGIGRMDLESALKNELAMRNPEKLPYVAVIHRLDQPVEGLVVFAKNPKAASGLSGQSARGEMKKCYLAVAQDAKVPDEERLEDWLRRDGRKNYSMVVPKNTPGSKRAVLDYRLLKRRNGKMLVRIQLLTGRHHQIRVQMAHRGIPLLGDRKYNPGTQDVPLGLCACELSFTHPFSGDKMDFCIQPKGGAFQDFFE